MGLQRERANAPSAPTSSFPGMPPSQLVQVSLPGPVGLVATFIDDTATVDELKRRLFDEELAGIRRSVLGSFSSPAAEPELQLDKWAIQSCVSSKPNTERTEDELQQLEERASFAFQELELSQDYPS